MEDRKIRKLRAILFADIDGYTAIMQRDEARARMLVQKFRREIETETASYSGEIIHFLGDGCLCIFESSVNALRCASALQRTFLTEPEIPVRMGLHSGDVYFEDDSVYGDSVNLASRIETLGVPGSILFSDRVRKDVRNQPDLLPAPLGSFHFKNVEETMDVFALANAGFVVPDRDRIKGKLAAVKPGRSRLTSNQKIMLLSAVFLGLLLLFRRDLISFVSQPLDINAQSAIAVLHFENDTGDSLNDIIVKMAADRIVHGITHNELGSVITGETIDEYNKIMLAGTAPIDQMSFLNRKFLVERVIGGNVYKEGDELVFECTITNASTKKVIHGLPTVRCSIDDPMQGIDELKQLLLGALASEEDKDRNLLLETSTPKFEAYKELELAKAADDDDRELFHLNRAIAIDSTYFEALVLRLSHYYNEDEYAFADSLMEEINLRLLNMDPRQRNLMNFYDALLKGRNNLIFKHLNDELRLAPFDLITNTSMVVLGLQFTNEVQKALAIYQEIPEQDLDYSNCSRCRTRLYLKMQIDLEQGNPDQAIESGQTLVKNGGWDLAYKLMVRAYVRTGNWEKVEQLGQVIPSGSTAEDPANHALTIAKECLLIDDNEHATHYVQVALSQINPKTTEITRGEILLLSGDHDGAADVFSELVGADSLNFTGWSYLAATKFNTNDQEQGSSIVQWLDQQKGPFQFGEIDYLVARALMIGGQSEAVIPRLRRSVEQGRLYQFHFFHNDFVFAPIHQDTEFVDLLEYWH